MKTKNNRLDRTLYASPFSLGYWRSATREMGNLRSLILAALFVALRVAVKSARIPLGELLHISLDFLVNSVGSMLYGPLMGLLVGAVSDTIGAILFPSGQYFFPFIAVEMISSFIFGLFLYRAKLSTGRILLSRFTVVAVCNFVVNPLIMRWYYEVVMGRDYALFRWARVIKSLCLFPVEATVLVLWLGVISRVTYRMKLSHSGDGKLRFTPLSIAGLVALTLLSAAGIFTYYYLKANKLV